MIYTPYNKCKGYYISTFFSHIENVSSFLICHMSPFFSAGLGLPIVEALGLASREDNMNISENTKQTKGMIFMKMVDGIKTFEFELSKGDFHHFYEIGATTLQGAIKIAQKWFVEEYGEKATHLERNVTGFPITRNI